MLLVPAPLQKQRHIYIKSKSKSQDMHHERLYMLCQRFSALCLIMQSDTNSPSNHTSFVAHLPVPRVFIAVRLTCYSLHFKDQLSLYTWYAMIIIQSRNTQPTSSKAQAAVQL
jgi:hypothetical protein